MFKAAEAKLFRILAQKIEPTTSYFVSFARPLKTIFHWFGTSKLVLTCIKLAFLKLGL